MLPKNTANKSRQRQLSSVLWAVFYALILANV